MRNKLIEYRGERTQKEMAEKYDVTQQTWSNWESGTSTPPPRIMTIIEKDSGCSMREIFFDAFNKYSLLE